MSALSQLRSTFDKAVKAWNVDSGPLDNTINAGEDLYFAAHNLINELEEQRTALLSVAARLATWDHCWPGNINLEQVAKEARNAVAKAAGQEAA